MSAPERVPLSDIVTETQYGTAKKANTDGRGNVVLRMNNITYGGRWDLRDLKHVELEANEADKYTVRRGDLLFNRTNSPELVGKTAVWDGPPNYAFAGYLVRVRFDATRVHSPYVSAFLNSAEGKNILFNRAKPSNNMSNISATDLLRLEVPLPPLPEQKRIAAILDKADAIRRKRQEAIRLTEELLRSVFLDMFGDLHTTGVHSLVDVVERFIDYRGKTPIKSTEGVPLVTAKVIKGGCILPPNEFIAATDYDAWMRRGLPERGDLLFTTEAPMGEMALVDDERIALAQRVVLIRPKQNLVNSTFLMWALRSPTVWHEINQRASGSTVRGIRQKELRQVSIPVPPIELQRRFASLASSIARHRAVNASVASTGDEFTRSLTQRAFSGSL